MVSAKSFAVLALLALGTSSAYARQLTQTSSTCPLPANAKVDLTALVKPCSKCGRDVSRVPVLRQLLLHAIVYTPDA